MLSSILNLVFLVVIGVFTIVSLLAVYVYIRYGRTLTITLASSAVFLVLYLIAVIAAYTTLQNLIDLYA